ncbi:hypothetical protein BB558_004900 [Smittium angustum]|uniref:Uncharacterized protein n=1 Tax=Smittium angustum TaxID=133377 RepID=A0A2U1J210_SMIAN|nr:hypothetical protein BB558_004900 [Smittium angustum]
MNTPNNQQKANLNKLSNQQVSTMDQEQITTIDPNLNPLDFLPKGWHWEVEPARTAFHLYKKILAGPLEVNCLNTDCQAVNSLIKDSSGKQLQTKARLTCNQCKSHFTPQLFIETYGARRGIPVPKATTWKDILPRYLSNIDLDPVENTATAANNNNQESSLDPRSEASERDFNNEMPVSRPKKRSADCSPPYISPTEESFKKQCDILVNQLQTVEKRAEEEIILLKVENSNLKIKLDLILKKLDQVEQSKSVQEKEVVAHQVLIPRSVETSKNKKKKTIVGATNKLTGLNNMFRESANQQLQTKKVKRLIAKQPTQFNKTILSTNLKNTETKSRPTYAEIAKKHAKTKEPEEIKKMQAALRKLSGVKPPYSGTKAEMKHKVSRIYVQGIQRMPFRELKKALFDMRFRLSKIIHIDFIGTKTSEFTVYMDYAASFVTKMKSLKIFKVLDKVNPAKPLDPNPNNEIRQAVFNSYTNRIQRAYDSSTRVDFKAYLLDLAIETGIPLTLENISETDYSEPSTEPASETSTVPTQLLSQDFDGDMSMGLSNCPSDMEIENGQGGSLTNSDLEKELDLLVCQGLLKNDSDPLNLSE